MMKFGWILTSAFILVGIISLPARAEVIPGRWEKVIGLAVETLIAVDLKNGDRIQGKFKRLSPFELSLRTGSARAVIPRADIERILSRRADSRRNGTLIGAGIGAGVSALLFVPAEDWDDSGKASAVLIGAGAGALIGFIADTAKKKDVAVIYQAP